MPRIQLLVTSKDPEVNSVIVELGEDAIVAEPDHFEGDVNLVSILVQVTAATIPTLAVLITQHIKSKRYIRVRYKGLDVQGESLRTIEKFLQSVADGKLVTQESDVSVSPPRAKAKPAARQKGKRPTP